MVTGVPCHPGSIYSVRWLQGSFRCPRPTRGDQTPPQTWTVPPQLTTATIHPKAEGVHLPGADGFRSTAALRRSDRASVGPSRSWSGCSLRSTKPGPCLAERPMPAHAPTPLVARQQLSHRLARTRLEQVPRRQKIEGWIGWSQPTDVEHTCDPTASNEDVRRDEVTMVHHVTSIGPREKTHRLPEHGDVERPTCPRSGRSTSPSTRRGRGGRRLVLRRETAAPECRCLHTEDELDQVLDKSSAP